MPLTPEERELLKEEVRQELMETLRQSKTIEQMSVLNQVSNMGLSTGMNPYLAHTKPNMAFTGKWVEHFITIPKGNSEYTTPAEPDYVNATLVSVTHINPTNNNYGPKLVEVKEDGSIYFKMREPQQFAVNLLVTLRK